MPRKYVDCRENLGSTCSLKISGNEDEVLKASVEHSVSTHGEKDTPEFRDEIKKTMKDEFEPSEEKEKVA